MEIPANLAIYPSLHHIQLSRQLRETVGWKQVNWALRDVFLAVGPKPPPTPVMQSVPANSHCVWARNPASKSIVEGDMPLFNGACPGIGKNRCVSTGDYGYTYLRGVRDVNGICDTRGMSSIHFTASHVDSL